MSDQSQLLTLAQARRLTRYTPRDLSVLIARHGFPLPWQFPPSSSDSDRGALYWDRELLEKWVLKREGELHAQLQ